MIYCNGDINLQFLPYSIIWMILSLLCVVQALMNPQLILLLLAIVVMTMVVIAISSFHGLHIVAYVWNAFHGRDALRVALQYRVPVRLIFQIVDVGGVDLVMTKDNNTDDKDGWNSIRLACRYGYKDANAAVEIISKLVEVGGRDIILKKDECHGCGWNALHFACIKNLPIEIISKLIEVGGRELVKQHNMYGYSALHFALNKNVSIDVVSKLIEVGGGKDVVTEKNKNGWNSLHYACYNNRLPNDILDLLIQHGGRELLVHANKKGKIPLDVVITKYSGNYSNEVKRKFLIERAAFLIQKGIELQVGGEYAIGGLFNCHATNNPCCFCWDVVAIPALDQVLTTLHSTCSSKHHQPIIQAAIMDQTPPHIIKDIVHRFTDSNNTIDSSGRYPIDVATQYKLAWDDGMKEIVEAFASVQKTTAFYVCAKHGVQWENGTKDSWKESGDVDIIERDNVSTDLYPFMLAALGGDLCYDLDSIFHLIKSSPKLVQRFDVD